MVTQMKDVVGRMFTQAGDSFRATMDAGLKMNEQAARLWSDSTQTPNMFDDIHRRGERFTDECMSTMQANLDQWKKGFDAQTQVCLDWWRQAFEAARGGSPADLQARTKDLCDKGVEAIRASTDSLMKGNVRMMERWGDLLTATGAEAPSRRPAGKNAQA